MEMNRILLCQRTLGCKRKRKPDITFSLLWYSGQAAQHAIFMDVLGTNDVVAMLSLHAKEDRKAFISTVCNPDGIARQGQPVYKSQQIVSFIGNPFRMNQGIEKLMSTEVKNGAYVKHIVTYFMRGYMKEGIGILGMSDRRNIRPITGNEMKSPTRRLEMKSMRIVVKRTQKACQSKGR